MTAHSTSAAIAPTVSSDAAALFLRIRDAIDAGKSQHVADLLDRGWRSPDLMRAVLLSGAADLPGIQEKRDPTANSPLIIQAIEHATNHGTSGSVEAIVKAARRVHGLAEAVLSVDHWNSYHGRVVQAAVWIDTCHGVTHAVTGLLNGFKDDP